jgi:hypothetical protein
VCIYYTHFFYPASCTYQFKNTKKIKMDFLPKNKYAALLVFMLVVVVAVTASLAVTRLVPDPKQAGTMRFKIGRNKKA